MSSGDRGAEEEARVSLGSERVAGAVLKEVPGCSHRSSSAANPAHLPIHSLLSRPLLASCTLVTTRERQVTGPRRLPSRSLQPVGQRRIEQITAHIMIHLGWGKCQVAEGLGVLKETQ